MSQVKTLELDQILQVDQLAMEISNQFTEWEMLRSGWMAEKKEIQNYIFATDTTKTTNSQLPWKNTTTLPKLCQIRDNLHANYMATSFPNSEWLSWVGDNAESETVAKRQAIKTYIKNKMRLSGAEKVFSQLFLDWIDYGNCFAMVEYVEEKHKDAATGEEKFGYVGPKFVRISPYDIVFNPHAATFDKTPKIIRSVMTLGDMKKMIQEYPEKKYLEDAFEQVVNNRRAVADTVSAGDSIKGERYQIDGFSDIQHYFGSQYVEVLEFYGDIYDIEKNELKENRIISVVDRSVVIRDVPNPSYTGNCNIRHVGWRQRPDNLYAMGPLDNLVGMQYRIDHLENLKADVFDLVAYPVIHVKGDVDDFEWAPMERIYTGEEGDVRVISPDAQALNADTQIAMLERKMEELAGAPREAMGIRTPGEKTAFEVQTLNTGSSRIFQNKTRFFDVNFLELLLNDFLEVGRRNLNTKDVIRVFDDELGGTAFLSITQEDLAAEGKLMPMGARHFAEQAQVLQNLNTLMNSAVAQDPAVSVHMSGTQIAKALIELTGLEKFDIYRPNVRISEQAETQSFANAMQEQVMMEQQTPSIANEDEALEYA